MKNDNNNSSVGTISCYVIDGTNKAGKAYRALQFGVMTEQGEYLSQLCFPTNLEMELVINAISGN